MYEPKTPTPWSTTLQSETRRAIDELSVSTDGKLHFKHKTSGFAYANLLDLLGPFWVIRSKSHSAEWRFGSVDEIINSGWAID